MENRPCPAVQTGGTTMTKKIDWLRGCATALVTPFTADGAVDEAALTRLIEYQLAGGVKLLVPCGTTGESATMTEEEDQRVIKRTIELARGRARVIAGTGSNSTASAIDNSRIAGDLGADAVLVVAPYYNKPTQQGLYAHYTPTPPAVDPPIVLCHVPRRTYGHRPAPPPLRAPRGWE